MNNTKESSIMKKTLIGADVKNVKPTPTPGARAGAATAQGLGKTVAFVGVGLKNIADFGRCLWTGKAS